MVQPGRVNRLEQEVLRTLDIVLHKQLHIHDILVAGNHLGLVGNGRAAAHADFQAAHFVDPHHIALSDGRRPEPVQPRVGRIVIPAGPVAAPPLRPAAPYRRRCPARTPRLRRTAPARNRQCRCRPPPPSSSPASSERVEGAYLLQNLVQIHFRFRSCLYISPRRFHYSCIDINTFRRAALKNGC